MEQACPTIADLGWSELDLVVAAAEAFKADDKDTFTSATCRTTESTVHKILTNSCRKVFSSQVRSDD